MTLTPKTKKYLIAGGLGLISIALAGAYLQYKKLMDYVLTFKSVKVKKFTKDIIDIDVFLNFQNKSNIEFNIKSQKYDVYVNGVFITKIENASPTTIKSETTSILPLNVVLKPSEIISKVGGAKGLFAMANPDTMKIKIDMKLQVQLWFFTINIPYTYEDTLKNMITPAK